MIRKSVIYSGHVQGVGFRFTVQRASGGFDVTGFVKNLPDGRVELVAEGVRDEVGRFLDEVAHRLRGNIHHVLQSENPTEGHFSKFEIRY